MRAAFVIVALIVPVIALAFPDDATLSRFLVGTWHGHRHDTQYRADGTWIRYPLHGVRAGPGRKPALRSGLARARAWACVGSGGQSKASLVTIPPAVSRGDTLLG